MADESGLSGPSSGEDPPSASRSPSADSTANADSPDSSTVLLLEDNPTDIFVIREVVRSCGSHLHLQIADNGRDALQFLESVDSDPSSPCPVLLLLDLNVPAIDGLEVLRRFRAQSRCKRTPVVIVTSSSAEKDRAAARLLGAEAYFEKPKDLSAYMHLADVVREVLHLPAAE